MADPKAKEILELQVPTTLKRLVEALIFAAKEPLTFRQMKDIYEGDGPQSYLRQLDVEEVNGCIGELNAEYEQSDKPYRIVRIAGGFQFATLAAYADWIGRLYKEQGRRKLSQSGIESLAIIAYKQPVTKADIESIRGVNCDYVLKTLLEKELVTVVGRAHAPGRPLLYGTTREFLRHFGLNEITDLPRPREIEEILGESQFETERRMLEAQAGAEKMKDEEPDFKSRLPHIPKKKPELDKPVEIRPRTGPRELKTVQSSEDTGQLEADLDSPKEAEEKIINSVDQVFSEKPIDVIGSPVGSFTPAFPGPNEVVGQGPAPSLGLAPTIDPPKHQQDDREPEHNIVPAGDGPPSVEVFVKENDEPNSFAKPFVDLPDEPVLGLTGTTVDAQQVVNKSKWQTWKEKVQGFIRRLFG